MAGPAAVGVSLVGVLRHWPGRSWVSGTLSE
jgi:hypothetical protein